MVKEKEIENKIFSTFSEIASSIGYSPLHGKIIGVLLVEDKPVSLQVLAEKTGYSTGMVSLSLDLLEILGVIKKVKKTADRKLYIKLDGDLLECLKKAFLIKLEKSIQDSLTEFGKNKEELKNLKEEDKEKALKTINILEKEIKRLEKYINLLSKIRLP